MSSRFFIAFISTFTLSFTLTTNIFASDCPDNNVDIFTQLFNEDLREFDSPGVAQQTNSCIPAEEILEILVGQFNLAALLRQDVFKRTNPIVVRSILDNPVVGRTRFHEERACLQTELFYNHAEQAFFTRQSPFIDSIISFDNQAIQSLIPTLENVLGVTGLIPFINMFRAIKIQERQAGFMFSVAGNYDNWHLAGRFPLYWVEHNFYLNTDEQNTIRNAPFLQQFNVSSQQQDDMEAFFARHFIADRLGLGDTRLKLEYLVHTTPSLDVFAGLSLTLPTAATISRGLLGGKFQKSFMRPDFSIDGIFELLMCQRDFQRAIQEGIDFATGALCQLTANVADRGLGNEGHFGFAPTVELCRQISDRAALELYAALEVFDAKNETRYFIEQKNIARLNDITANFGDFDNAMADAALAFLNEQLINTFYPFVVRTNVRPGVILKVTPRVHMFINDFTAWFGYDFWWQADEEINKIRAPDPLRDRLKVERGRKPRAEQHRLFFDLRWYVWSNACADWEIALKGDWTIRHLGIGDNFTAAVGLEGLF